MTDSENPLNLSTELLGEVVAYAHQAQSLTEVTDEETSETARILRSKLKSVEQRIENARVAAKAPYLQGAKQIDGLANVIFAQVRPHIERLDQLRLKYKAAFDKPAMPVVPPSMFDPSVGVPNMSALAMGSAAVAPTIRTRTTKDIQINDPSQVPDEFWVIDEVKLRKAVLQDKRDVPGVVIVEKQSVLE